MQTYTTFAAPSNVVPIVPWAQDSSELIEHDPVTDIIAELRSEPDDAREAELIDRAYRIMRRRMA